MSAFSGSSNLPNPSSEDVNLSDVVAIHQEFQEPNEDTFHQEDIKMEIEDNMSAIPEDVDLPTLAGDNEDVRITFVKKEVMSPDEFAVHQLVDDLLKFVEYFESLKSAPDAPNDGIDDFEVSEPPVLTEDLDSDDSSNVSSDSDDVNDTIHFNIGDSSSFPVNGMTLASVLQFSPTPPRPIIFLNGSQSGGAPSMVKKRDPNVYQWCLEVAEFIGKELTEDEIQDLLQNPRGRGKLFKKYQDRDWLAAGGPQEALPIYAALMAPLTRTSYLEGIRDEKLPTANMIHVHIFKASRVSDSETVECLKMYQSGHIDARKLKTCLLLIGHSDGRWRGLANSTIQRMLYGARMVDTVDDVPEFGFLACFGELPDVTKIQAKQLTCLVIDPSKKYMSFLGDQPSLVRANVTEAAYGGNQGTLTYYCFGPKVIEVSKESKRCVSISVAGAFVFSMGMAKNTALDGPIYTVNGYF